MDGIDEITITRIGLGIFNIVMILIIMFIACQDYRRVHARFTLGVIFFGLALLFHTLVTNPLFHLQSCSLYAGDIIFVLFLASDAFAAVALSVFLYLIKN